MTEHYSSVLILERLKAQVHLGVGPEERRKAQEVAIDVRFYLPQPPPAAKTDNGEYICYHDISAQIHALCVRQEYRLIEFLTHEIYRLLRKETPAEVKLWVKLHKLRILLPYVEGGTSYTFTDLPASALVIPQ